MRSRLTPERQTAIVRMVMAGKTIPEINAATGEAKRTIAYVAASHGLTIQSRYARIMRGSYWQSMRGGYWRLNAQLKLRSLLENEHSYGSQSAGTREARSGTGEDSPGVCRATG